MGFMISRNLAQPILSGIITSAVIFMTTGTSWALPLSPGDRLRVLIPGDEGLPVTDQFSGVYEINLDGTLQLPFIDPVPVAGLELVQVEQRLRQILLEGGFFQPSFLQVSVKIVQWAPIQVTVSGATFNPGRVLVNQRNDNTGDRPVTITPLTGEYPPERYLTAAIRQAGGVTPEADILNVRLIRGNQEQTIDLSGMFTGAPVNDIPLIAGDQIIVPKRQTLDNELVRPSQITPEQINVFFSNLSTPNQGGNVQVEQVAYGTRFAQAAVAAKCIGGSTVDAKRRVTLLQTDRVTGKVNVIDRSVEDLVRKQEDGTTNPFLMPDDGVVCYDSKTRNVSSIFSVIGNIINPISGIESLIRRLFFNNN